MNQLKVGATLSYLIIAINIIIGIAYTPVLLRMLGQAEYGLYSLAASVIAYLTVLDLGFANAIVRYTAKFRAQGKVKEQYEMFGMFLRLYIFIGLIAFLLAMVLLLNVDRLFGETMTSDELETMRTMMMLMAFNLAFTFPLSIYGAIISAYENFVFQKLVNIVRVILNPLIMIIFLHFGYKAVTMVVVTTILNLSTLLINMWYCYNRLHIKVLFAQFNWEFMKEVSLYSFWIFLNAIMDRIYWSTGQFILGIYRGADEVAIYAIAIQLKTMFFMFSTAIAGVFLPRITQLVTKGASSEEISNLFIRLGRIQYILMSYILSGFILLGYSFIGLWAGKNYQEAYSITLLLFIPALVPLIQNLGISILQAHNKMKFRALVYLAISVTSIFVSIPLAQIYGGIGCAIATSAALTLGQGVIMNIYYKRKVHIDIPHFWKEIGKMSVVPFFVVSIGLVVIGYVSVVSLFHFLIAGVVFTVLYIPLFWLFSMNQSERELINEPIKKIYTKIDFSKKLGL